MGERVSHDGIVAIVCHGDMGIMFFFMCGMGEISCLMDSKM